MQSAADGKRAEIERIYRDLAGKPAAEVERILGLFNGREAELLAKLQREWPEAGAQARVAELREEIRKQRRIIVATGMSCNCPGCDGDQADEWAPRPVAAVQVGGFATRPHAASGAAVDAAVQLKALEAELADLEAAT
jgi:hypothetical protein